MRELKCNHINNLLTDCKVFSWLETERCHVDIGEDVWSFYSSCIYSYKKKEHQYIWNELEMSGEIS